MEHRTPKRKNIFEAFYNVLAALITPPFLKTSWTPNQITVLSGLFGVIGAFLLVFQNHILLILAAVCIQLFAALDLVDGNIARAKKLQSVFGHWLDIFFDKLNDFLLISALTIGAYRAVGKEHVLLLGLGLMGLVFFIQFVMILNHTLLKVTLENDEKTNNYKRADGKRILLNLLKKLGQLLQRHFILGHSAFLLLISVFACLNSLYFGLWFLFIHALITLVVIVAHTFYRLRQYEKL
jgi:phosphatidylglycerophosphate synthase